MPGSVICIEICVVERLLHVNLVACGLRCSCICVCWTDNVMETYALLRVLYFRLLSKSYVWNFMKILRINRSSWMIWVFWQHWWILRFYGIWRPVVSCPVVHLVHIQQRCSWVDFLEISCLGLLLKFVDTIGFFLKSYKSNIYFTWRATDMISVIGPSRT